MLPNFLRGFLYNISKTYFLKKIKCVYFLDILQNYQYVIWRK